MKKLKPNVTRLFLDSLISYIFNFIIFSILLYFIKFYYNLKFDIFKFEFILFTYFLILLILKYFKIKSIIYLIDDKKLIYKSKFISEIKLLIPIKEIVNMDYNVSFFLDKIFNTGSINIYTSGSSFIDLKLEGISNVEDTYNLLNSYIKLGKSKKIDKNEGFVLDKNDTFNQNLNLESYLIKRIKPDLKKGLLYIFVINLFFFFFSFIFLALILMDHHFLIKNIVVVLFLIIILFLIPLLVSLYIQKRNLKKIYYDFYKDKLEFYDGFFNLKKSTISYNRITNIFYKQDFIERTLNIYTIYINTAGSAFSEITIKYVKNGDEIAKFLKEVILKNGRD